MELPFWQLTAAFVAAALLGVAAIALLRSATPVIAVALALLVAIPCAGFAAYAIVPGPAPRFGSGLTAAYVSALVAFGAGVWIVVAGAARRAPLTASWLASLTLGMIVMWEGIVVALSMLLAEWEPLFAIANLALNAAWAMAWIPAPVRRLKSTSTIEIAAPRSAVYEFVAEPLNWLRYDEDLVSVSVKPAGPLRAGCEVTQVRRFEPGVRGPRVLPNTLESKQTVTEVTAGRSFSSRDATGIAWSATEFGDGEGKTRVTTRAQINVPYRSAFLGGLLMLLWQRPARLAKARRNLARLKAILESPKASD
ncbi:MAG TPA: SRPBCC family protein [Candidatus Sulfotelmatobacter sp.]|nr:SRPBCC family protein [Candidatus Sulfotelmatobacter sp.]